MFTRKLEGRPGLRPAHRGLVRALAATSQNSPAKARAELRCMTVGDVVFRLGENGLVVEISLAYFANLLNKNGIIRVGSGGRI